MSGFIERLRREQEEADRIKRILKEEISRAERERREASSMLLQQREAQEKAERDRVEAFYEESEFPRLLGELRRLSNISEVDVDDPVKIYPSETTVHGADGYGFNAYNIYHSPVIVRRSSRYAFAHWRTDNHESDSITSLLLRRFRILNSQPYSYHGFVIEANPQGDIIAHGATQHILTLNQWRGNPVIQESVLEQVYTNPFTPSMEYHAESTGYTGSAGDSPGPG